MSLKQLIASRRAQVGVVGLGYVGLPVVSAFHRAGFPVIGFYTDPGKIDHLHRGETYLQHLGKEFVAQMRDASRFDATGDFRRLCEPDAICICVPTPLGKAP
jgi:UDP-N-acetyl-D-glucosamine dehydrogenase